MSQAVTAAGKGNEMELARTEGEVCELLNQVDEREWEGEGSRFPGMSYEQGIMEALRWVIGDTDEYPYPKR